MNSDDKKLAENNAHRNCCLCFAARAQAFAARNLGEMPKEL
jgi:hypothetical protein